MTSGAHCHKAGTTTTLPYFVKCSLPDAGWPTVPPSAWVIHPTTSRVRIGSNWARSALVAARPGSPPAGPRSGCVCVCVSASAVRRRRRCIFLSWRPTAHGPWPGEPWMISCYFLFPTNWRPKQVGMYVRTIPTYLPNLPTLITWQPAGLSRGMKEAARCAAGSRGTWNAGALWIDRPCLIRPGCVCVCVFVCAPPSSL